MIGIFFINMGVVEAETGTCSTHNAVPVCNMESEDGQQFRIEVCYDKNDKISTSFFIAIIDGKQYHYTNKDYSEIVEGYNGSGTSSRKV